MPEDRCVHTAFTSKSAHGGTSERSDNAEAPGEAAPAGHRQQQVGAEAALSRGDRPERSRLLDRLGRQVDRDPGRGLDVEPVDAELERARRQERHDLRAAHSRVHD
jgi:hypothetical protein